MRPLPPEAREGVMRAWLAILHERHPNVTWLPAEQPNGATIVPFPRGQASAESETTRKAA